MPIARDDSEGERCLRLVEGQDASKDVPEAVEEHANCSRLLQNGEGAKLDASKEMPEAGEMRRALGFCYRC